jgi:hypothetical protein
MEQPTLGVRVHIASPFAQQWYLLHFTFDDSVYRPTRAYKVPRTTGGITAIPYHTCTDCISSTHKQNPPILVTKAADEGKRCVFSFRRGSRLVAESSSTSFGSTHIRHWHSRTFVARHYTFVLYTYTCARIYTTCSSTNNSLQQASNHHDERDTHHHNSCS